MLLQDCLRFALKFEIHLAKTYNKSAPLNADWGSVKGFSCGHVSCSTCRRVHGMESQPTWCHHGRGTQHLSRALLWPAYTCFFKEEKPAAWLTEPRNSTANVDMLRPCSSSLSQLHFMGHGVCGDQQGPRKLSSVSSQLSYLYANTPVRT